LSICFKRLDNKSDDDKLANLYLKIGLALQQFGNNIEAIDYFDRYLKIHGFSYPKNKLIKTLGFVYSLFYFIFAIYFNKYFFKKPITKAFGKILMIFSQRTNALSTINPSRAFIEGFYFSRFFCEYELSGMDSEAGHFYMTSVFFSWSGISFNIANKILEISKKKLNERNYKSYMKYQYSRSMYEYITGNRDKRTDIDYTYDTGMRLGAFWETTIFTLFNGLKEIESGSWKETKKYIDRLLDTSEYFENSHAKAQHYRLKSRAYNKFRMLDDTLKSTDEGKLFTAKTGHTAMLLVIYCNRSIAFSLKNDLAEAEINLQEAEKLIADRKRVALYYTAHLLAKTHYEIVLLNKSRMDKEVAKNALQSSKLLVRKSKKAVGNLTEAYRLRANIYWMLNKRSKAFHNFSKAIATSVKYNGKLELSRTYFELGKFLSHPKTKRKQLNGLSGKEYLEKARAMFEDMDLQWDLGEYQKHMDN